MLILSDSNRYEALTSALLDNLDESALGGDYWRPDAIIVPSTAVKRRLELDIAARFGICANIQFNYLAQWLWAQIGRVMDLAAASAFTPDQLVWRCHRLLEPNAWADASRIGDWLRAADEPMRYELSQRIARLFERYLIYRPDWLNAWRQGQSILTSQHTPTIQKNDECWQSRLWRQLCAECGAASEETALGAYHFLTLALNLDADTVNRARWPNRLHVFALPAIAPLHLALLRTFARWIDVRIYTLNPCRLYWDDWVSASQRADLALHGQADHAEVGNVLLTEWGQPTQTHLRQLHALADTIETVELSRHIENPAPTWLAALQNAWLNGQAWPAPPAANVLEPFSVIEVHVCHSLTRQLEVLHDRLLALFNANEPDTAPLSPSEVLVTVPDLAAAAPLIDAVFGATDGVRRIPYRLTGLPATRTHPAARMLCDLLRLPTRRIIWSELIEWLRIDWVAARYGLDARALETVERWCNSAGAPCVEPALTRLYLGYALPDGADPIAGVLPVPAIAHLEDLELLGRVSRFISDLDDFAHASAQAATADAWQLRLLDALERFFLVHPQETERLVELRAALHRLFAAMQSGAAETRLPAPVIRSALMSTFEESTHGGVPTGGVTFCTLASLHSLPYRVVCLLGMDDGALPSRARPDEFDLTTAFPRVGDRQRRQEELNLFLDLILAARERLLIAYTGRHLSNNTPLPPAAVVNELLDHLGAAWAAASGDHSQTAVAQARQRFIVEHPLQPFAAEYCSRAEPSPVERDAPHLFTYDPDRAAIAAALNGRPARARTPFFVHPLPPPENRHKNKSDSAFFGEIALEVECEDRMGIDAGGAGLHRFAMGATPQRDQTASANNPAQTAKKYAQVIEFSAFERFWRHPVRALLRERLGIQLAETPPVLPELESFTLDGAGRRALAERALPLLLAADAREGNAAFEDRIRRVRQIMQASPELPEGALGAALCAAEVDALLQFSARIRNAGWQPPTLRLFALELTPAWPAALAHPEHDATGLHEPVRLEGLLPIAGHGALVLYRYGSVSARDYLSAWLHHLIRCAAAPADQAPRTVWLGHPDGFALKPAARAAARAYLSEWVALYRVGHCVPLRFFPNSAWALVNQGEAAARQVWAGNSRKKGEADNAWLRIALRGDTLEAALDARFSSLARTVFSPLIEHLDLSAAL